MTAWLHAERAESCDMLDDLFHTGCIEMEQKIVNLHVGHECVSCDVCNSIYYSSCDVGLAVPDLMHDAAGR